MVQTRSGAGNKRSHSTAAVRKPSIGFFDFPREIRDQIYTDALVRPGSLSVCIYMKDSVSEDLPQGYQHVRDKVLRDLKGAGTNLLLVSRTIATEAALIFYSKNTFEFYGMHEYSDEVSWLRSIGPVNRGYLRYLEIYVNHPEIEWQLEEIGDEVKEGDADAQMNNVDHARHQPHEDEPRYRPVQINDPDLETVFALIGSIQSESASDVHFELINTSLSLVGVERDYEEMLCFLRRYPPDLPNLVEAWRINYSGMRNIEVTWSHTIENRHVDDSAERYTDAGWLIHERIKHERHETLRLKRQPNANARSKQEVGFLDLPREIRDKIYTDAMTSSKKVEVFRHLHKSQLSNLPKSKRLKWLSDMDIRDLQDININFLLTCKTVFQEAAAVFYGKNTFAFFGEHGYHHEVQWLHTIGPLNRGFLKSLYIDVRPPSRAWQLEDGTREGFEDDYIAFDRYHARHHLLQKPVGTLNEEIAPQRWQEGEVLDIDPDMETIFTLLGQTSQTSCPSIDIQLFNHSFDEHPGAELTEMDYRCDVPYYSMDLANLVEAWRSSLSTLRETKVTWIDLQDDSEWADDFKERFEKAGWIVERGGKSEEDESHILYLTSKPHNGPIIACQAIPFPRRRPAKQMAYRGTHGLHFCKHDLPYKVGEDCACGQDRLSTSLAPDGCI